MKILLATSAAVPAGGGVASYNQELVKSLKDKNDFYLLTSADEHNVEGYIRTDCIHDENIFDFHVTKRLIDSVNGEGYDLIINSDSEFVTVAAPFLSAPIISVAHFVNGIFADRAGYNSPYNNAIIALSYYGKKYLEKKFRIKDSSKVKVVYNFVHPSPKEYKKDTNERIKIVYPGGTSIKKSVDVVMEVAYRLKQTDCDFSFIWLGGSLLPSANFSFFRIKDIKQMLHGDERFTITGKLPRQEAEEIISSANIFLLPSRGEGCPMTLLEAMRDGCIPIVSDAKHGSRELIELSKAGFITKQNDSKSIASLIKDIILQHEKYSDYYAKTKLFSDTKLSPKEWTSQMLSIFEETTATPKKTLKIDLEHFKESINGYVKLKKQDRRNAMISSAVNRIKMDWLYLKWRGWR